MYLYKYLQSFAAVAVALSISACNIGATAPPTPREAITPSTTQIITTDTPTAPETSPTEAATATSAPAASSCDNPYMPVVEGATWDYKLTGPIPDTYTHTILSVEDNGFTEQDTFGTGVTRQGKWQCDQGNLIALNPSGGNSANVTTEGVSVDFETKELSGVTLPASIKAGDTWSQSLTLEGTQTIGGVSYAAGNQLTSDCTASGIESVTVEAGTFDAMRVECQTDMKITIALDPNNPMSTPLSVANTYWYAENIGMIKNTTSGSGLDSAIELVSYNIP